MNKREEEIDKGMKISKHGRVNKGERMMRMVIMMMMV